MPGWTCVMATFPGSHGPSAGIDPGIAPGVAGWCVARRGAPPCHLHELWRGRLETLVGRDRRLPADDRPDDVAVGVADGHRGVHVAGRSGRDDRCRVNVDA